MGCPSVSAPVSKPLGSAPGQQTYVQRQETKEKGAQRKMLYYQRLIGSLGNVRQRLATKRKPPAFIVDDHRAEQEVVQKPPPFVEEADQEHQRGQRRGRHPERDGMDRAEQEIAWRPVPCAHFEIDRAHADGGGRRSPHGGAAVEERPDYRSRHDEEEQPPAQTEGDQSEKKDKDAGEDDRNRDDDEVDQEGDHAPRQHPFEIFRV